MIENMKKISSETVYATAIMQVNWQNKKDNTIVSVNNNANNNSGINKNNHLETDSHRMNACEEKLVNNDNEQETEKATNSADPFDELQSVLTNSNSNKSSTNDSTDNLSLLSDTGIVEELMLLPDNISDEELSINSDDCIYAYRGADFESPEFRNNLPDDETDFLEMDFDPDPASELDNTNECDSSFKISHDHESNIDPISNLSKLNFEKRGNLDLDVKMKCSQLATDETSSNTQNNVSSNEQLTNAETSTDNKIENYKITGAKPKKISDKTVPKAQKTSKLSGNFDIVLNQNLESTFINKQSEETCLDCLEKEFLSKSFGRNIEPFECRKCQFKFTDKTRSNAMPEPYFQSSVTDFVLPHYKEFLTPLEKIHQMPLPYEIVDETEIHDKNENKKICSFPSINVDENIVAQALEKLEVNFDKESLKRYFSAIENKSTFKDVSELIIYMSKKNCDYKRTIKAIESACTEKLSITYKANEDYSHDEMVRVNSYDILQAWTPKSDLQKLKRLDKRFLQMNILGKVINVIRQAQQRNLKSSGEFILIPQYYKTGCIYVAKK